MFRLSTNNIKEKLEYLNHLGRNKLYGVMERFSIFCKIILIICKSCKEQKVECINTG